MTVQRREEGSHKVTPLQVQRGAEKTTVEELNFERPAAFASD